MGTQTSCVPPGASAVERRPDVVFPSMSASVNEDRGSGGSIKESI